MKNFTLHSIHFAAIVLPVLEFPANTTCSFDISCSALNFLTLYTYSALIKISSDSQYTVSLTCTEANNQLMLKHCSKRDKVTKINYQQPHYLLYYCHLSENNEKKPIYYGAKREALSCEQNSAKKFCYQSYQNSIHKHDCTFMLHKKVTIATIKKKDT